MDVVGGFIVAAGDLKDDHRAGGACGRRVMKRARCGSDYGDAQQAAALMIDEPWNFHHHHHRRVTPRGGKPGSAGVAAAAAADAVVDLHEDYELRSVLSLYRPAHAPVLSKIPPLVTRSWVDPLQFLLKKELTVTDVGDLGRIILPKRDAECQLPHLDSKEGKLLCMEDYNSNKNWTLRYKWWPNNKSRMYVLESTGEFVKYYDLKEKDELIVYRDGVGNLVIRGQKWSSSPLKTGSFFGSSRLKGMTPTGKRSPKGRSNNLAKAGSSASLDTSVQISSTTTTTTATTTSTSMFSSNNTSYVVNPDLVFKDGITATLAPSIVPSIAPTLVGHSYASVPVPSDHGVCIDWEKLPDPPAIEFTDPPALEFPGEFEYTWGDCI